MYLYDEEAIIRKYSNRYLKQIKLHKDRSQGKLFDKSTKRENNFF